MNKFILGMLTMSMEGPRELRGGAEQETPLLTVPLFHGTGLVSGLLMPLQLGQKVVMMYKWDTEGALKLIEEEKITGLTSVPAVLQNLFTHPEFDNYDTSTLFRVGAAGAATPDGLPELIESKIDKVSRSAGWGMTETMSVGTTMSGEIYNLNPAASGIASPLVELRSHLASKLANYKVPKFIALVDEPLPQNAGGKLFKRKIRDEYIAAIPA